MKRILSFMLIMTITLSSILSLGGCSSKKQSTLSLGEWLVMLNSSFGMDSYNSDTPYFDNVSESNIYFDAVQIAVEWDVIDTTQKIDVNKALTWCDALMTLVNASVFRAYTMTSEEKLDYALANFDCKIDKKKVNNIIEPYDAVALLTQVQQKWTNRTYDTPIEEVKFADSVKELTDVTDYKIENNTVVLRKEEAGDIAAGDVYVINGEDGLQAFKAEKVTEQDGNIYIENSDEDLFITDVVENMFVQETIIPSVDNMVLYDAYGNRIGGNDTAMSAQRMSLMQMTDKVSAKITYGDYEIEFGREDNKIKVKVRNKKLFIESEFEISNISATSEIDIRGFKINSAGLKFGYDEKRTFSFKPEALKPINLVAVPYEDKESYGIKDILNSTFEQVNENKDAEDYVEQTIKVGSFDLLSAGVVKVKFDVNIKLTVEGKISIVITSSNTQGVEYKNRNIRYIHDRTYDVDLVPEAKAELTIPFGLGLYTMGMKKSLIGIDISGGVGVKAKSVWHLVDEETHLIDSLPLDSYPGGIGDSIMSMSISASRETIAGVAAKQGGKYVSAEADVKLKFSLCQDLIAYGILKIELKEESQISKLLKIELKLTHEFLNDKNASFFHAHIEDFKFAEGFANAKWGSDAYKLELCTKKFKPFDEADEEESETAEDESIQSDDGTIIEGKYISLSQLGVSLSHGEQYTVGIETLPEGYSIADVKYSVQDTSVATVNSNGLVTAIAEGSTMLVVYIEGTEYKAYQAIMIINPDTVTMSPLM